MKRGIILFLSLCFFIALTPVSSAHTSPLDKTNPVILSIQPDDVDWLTKLANSIISREPDAGEYPWNWGEGILMYGMWKAYEETDNISYFNYVKSFIDTYVDVNGNVTSHIKNKSYTNGVSCAIVLPYLYTHTNDSRYLTAANIVADYVFNDCPRTSEGALVHRNDELWDDTLPMICIFFTQMGCLTGEDRFFNEAANQIILHADKLQDSSEKLFYHGWDKNGSSDWADPATHQSPCFWARGNGWIVMSLIDLLEYIPDTHPQKNTLVEIFQNLVSKVIEYQNQSTGLWYTVIDQSGRSGNYLETSASAMFVYGIQKGIIEGHIDANYQQNVNKGNQGLNTRIYEDGSGLSVVTGISIGTIVGDYDYYVSKQTEDNITWGLGAFLMAKTFFRPELSPPEEVTSYNFDDGNVYDWSAGKTGRWSVGLEHGRVAYYINTSDYQNTPPEMLGELSYILSEVYREFRFTCLARSIDDFKENRNADFCIVFGYGNDENYYYMMFNRGPGLSGLYKIVDQVRYEVALADGFVIPDNEYHQIEIIRVDNFITVKYDGEIILTTSDCTNCGGQLGLGSYNDAAAFDDVAFSYYLNQGAISGTVYESDGITPIADAQVALIDFCPVKMSATRYAYTNSFGYYIFNRRFPGCYIVKATGEVNQKTIYVGKYYNNTTNIDEATSVNINKSKTTGGINFILERIGAISGTVYENDGVTPIPGVRVTVYDQSWVSIRGKNTNSDGYFIFEGLSPGDYYVGASDKNYWIEYFENSSDYSNAIPVSVNTVDTTKGVDFTLEKKSTNSGVICGTVYEDDGITPDSLGAEVTLYDINWNELDWGYCNENGEYIIDELQTGSYYLRANICRCNALIGHYYKKAYSQDEAMLVTVTEPDTTKDIDFSINAYTTISGTVYRNDGKTPINNLEVLAITIIYDYDCFCIFDYSTYTDSAGHYTFNPYLGKGYYILTDGNVLDQGDVYERQYYDRVDHQSNAEPVGYASIGINFRLSLKSDNPVNIHIKTSPDYFKGTSLNMEFFIDDLSHLTPGVFQWAPTDIHVIELKEYYIMEDNSRLYFMNWSFGGENRKFDYTVPSSDKTITANYQLYYKLDVISEFGSPTESNWYPAQQEVEIFVDSTIIEKTGSISKSSGLAHTDSIRHVFDHWAGIGNGSYTGIDNPAMVVMKEDIKEVAHWRDQYPLIILINDTSFGSVLIEPNSIWQYKDSTVTLKAVPKSGYLFVKWEGSLTGTHDSTTFVMDTSKVISAVFGQQTNQSPQICIPDSSFMEDDTLFISCSSLDYWITDPDHEFSELTINITDYADHFYCQYDTTGISLYADPDWNGSGWAVINVTDPLTASIEDTIHCSVVPVNDPPGSFDLIFPEEGYKYTDSTQSLVFSWHLSENSDFWNYDTIKYTLYIEYEGSTVFSVSSLVDTTFANPDLQVLQYGTYQWYVIAFDKYGLNMHSSSKNNLVTSVLLEKIIPENFKLYHNFPNPFNPFTYIKFDVPKNEKVTIEIYSSIGKQIKVLFNEICSTGTHVLKWNGTDHTENSVAPGIYFCRMKAGSYTNVTKMLFLK